ncbi:MAG: B12-binding domain-containing radical SAM protein [Clostridium sp.]|nr:B12-binding domain-containing radical SAM protein [Clostridium sp.]
MHIKLIQPLMHMRPMDTHLKNRMSPPLGLYTIVNMFRDEHTVTVENENVQNLNLADIPDIVGISVNVDSLPRALEIAKIYLGKAVPVVLGGILPTTAPEIIPDMDNLVLCIGAAEGTWPDIINDLGAGCLKKKYICQHGFTGDMIVPPAYDLIPSGLYLYRNIFHTSRGCPFRCDFCYNSSNERWYVCRPVGDVVKEVSACGTKHVMFIDDNFIGNLKWTRELMKELKRMKVKWNASVSINVVNIPGLLDEMKDSGCQGLFIGFESINPSSVSGVHKVQNDVSMYEHAVEEIHRRGIMINASFVFGLDSDTPETFQTTLDWIVRNRIDTVTSHILTPYPGTELYRRMKEDGRLLTDDLGLYDTAHVVFRPKSLTKEELYDGYIWLYDQIYSFRNIIRRLPLAARQIPAYLMFNFFYRKWGRFTDWLCRRITYERIGRWGERLSRYM